MSILWIYDNVIDPQAGGTERATHLVMAALEERGYRTAGFLVFRQDQPRVVCDPKGNRVDNLYAFLKENDVHVVVNQIGYSKWLLQEFLDRGGQRWNEEGGRIITKLHFDPLMFSTTLRDLTRHWSRRTPIQKVRRLGRIALLPLERRKASRVVREAYTYLIEKSDHFIILSEKHRQQILAMSGTRQPERIHAIPNPNTFTVPYPTDRLKQKRKSVLIVSRLDEPQKRVSLALKAWAHVMCSSEFDDWTLRVVGDGDYGEDYRDLIAEKHIPNVEFIGRTDPEPYYNDASLYLHTAKREGWGLTITEAMQKGAVPIVMSSSSVFEELIDHGENGILSKDGNVKTYAAHISDLMRHREKREGMAVRAILKTQQHDLESIVEKWSVVINDRCTTPFGPIRLMPR